MTIPTAEQVEFTEKLIDFLDSIPDQHDQRVWLDHAAFDRSDQVTETPYGRPIYRMAGKTVEQAIDCGTAGCAAGWACILDEREIAGDWIANYWVLDDDGVWTWLPEWATKRMGLPAYEGTPSEQHMFAARNSLADLRSYAKASRESFDSQRPVEDVWADWRDEGLLPKASL